MYQKYFLIFMGAALCWPQFGWTIGRAGGGSGIMDIDLGFETEVSPEYFNTQALSDGSLKVSKLRTGPAFIKEQYLNFVPLNLFFPELNSMDRQDSRIWKIHQGGTILNHVDPCVDVHVYQSSTFNYGTAQWGVGKGVAVFGPLDDGTRAEIVKTLTALKLSPGACIWK